MGHDCPGDFVNAGVAKQGALGKLGQHAVESWRQIIVDLAQLLLDDMKIIKKPFRRRGDRSVGRGRPEDGAIGRGEDSAIVAKPLGDRAALLRVGCDALRHRQALRVLLEPLDTENFRADGRLGR